MPPAPNPNARRRNKESQWSLLPARCDLKAPPIPLDEPSPDERRLWVKLWKMPQATRWHKAKCDLEVAVYCRLMVRALEGDGSVVGEVRQLGDRLGTTTLGLARNRWVIESDEIQPVRQRAKRKSGLRIVQ